MIAFSKRNHNCRLASVRAVHSRDLSHDDLSGAKDYIIKDVNTISGVSREGAPGA